MKKLILNFSDKLLSKQQLKSIKGGNYYCMNVPGHGAPVNTANAEECAILKASPCPNCVVYTNCGTIPCY